jgi:hypothetical protein
LPFPIPPSLFGADVELSAMPLVPPGEFKILVKACFLMERDRPFFCPAYIQQAGVLLILSGRF